MKWWHWLVLELLIIFGVIAWIYFFPSEFEYDLGKGMIAFALIYVIEECKDIKQEEIKMKKIKGYNIVKEKTNELLVSIEVGNDEVIERNGYKVIPFYEEGNPPKYSCKECEETKKDSQYRPFNDCNELIEHYQKKYKSAVGCDIYFPSLYKPVIWVKHKEYGIDFLITAFDNNNESIGANVIINDMGVTMKMLFDNYTFCDGSICGVEV